MFTKEQLEFLLALINNVQISGSILEIAYSTKQQLQMLLAEQK